VSRSEDSSWRAIKIDTRESLNAHPLWFEDGPMAKQIEGTFAQQGFKHTRQKLDVGDFHIELRVKNPLRLCPLLKVESKLWDDLVASLRDDGAGRADSRIRHQLDGLLDQRARGVQVALMVVGTMYPAGGLRDGVMFSSSTAGRRYNRPWNYWELHAALAAIQHLGIMVIFSPSEEAVPRTLRMAAEVAEREEHFAAPGLPKIASLSPKLGQLARTLTAVEGIGQVTAIDIARAYHGSFPEFFTAGVKELQEVKGVGKITAQRIHAHFHDIVEEAEADESLAAVEKRWA
jgi:ERCC4-type nuclease